MAPSGPRAEPQEFASEARLLYRVVACAGDAELPRNVDARVVDAHCRQLETMLARYRTSYVSVASPFLAKLRPKDLPEKVVYPFSGGDLVTAITTYPDAAEYTTVSLELAGDPRRIHTVDAKSLDVSLRKLRIELAELLDLDAYSKSETLKKTQRGEIPGELSFFLVSLAVHGLEPVSMRYFAVEADGSIRYLSAADIAASTHELADQRKATWTPPDFSEAFANVEIRFKKAGDPSAPVRIHRHIAQNLDDAHLAPGSAVLAHLAEKGKVAAMTKAASYLLWTEGFSDIRTYLLEHAVFMVSDSTGIPPPLAKPAGFVQETYGSFGGSLLRASASLNQAFIDLWRSEPKRALAFRYGYRDRKKQNHLLVTKKG